jgi:enoyl-[acyl-carrier protein] reductase I
MMSDLLKNKKIAIFGVANERSIAWAIAQALKNSGAKIALSYMNDAILKRVEPLSKELGADFIFEFDATQDSHYDKLLSEIKKHWNEVDVIIHSMAFADKEDLKTDFIGTSRAGFSKAMDISAYSLVGICQKLEPILTSGGSVVTMTYHGSQKAIPGYNVMGVAKAALEASVRYLAVDLGKKEIKVNAISAGPIKTLASSGIAGFRDILGYAQEKSPIKKNVSQDDVAQSALYLSSPLSSGVTGQILYVDSGLSIMGI